MKRSSVIVFLAFVLAASALSGCNSSNTNRETLKATSSLEDNSSSISEEESTSSKVFDEYDAYGITNVCAPIRIVEIDMSSNILPHTIIHITGKCTTKSGQVIYLLEYLDNTTARVNSAFINLCNSNPRRYNESYTWLIEPADDYDSAEDSSEDIEGT